MGLSPSRQSFQLKPSPNFQVLKASRSQQLCAQQSG